MCGSFCGDRLRPVFLVFLWHRHLQPGVGCIRSCARLVLSVAGGRFRDLSLDGPRCVAMPKQFWFVAEGRPLP